MAVIRCQVILARFRLRSMPSGKILRLGEQPAEFHCGKARQKNVAANVPGFMQTK